MSRAAAWEGEAGWPPWADPPLLGTLPVKLLGPPGQLNPRQATPRQRPSPFPFARGRRG